LHSNDLYLFTSNHNARDFMGKQRAFIFDMDGTIVDNMAFHTKAWTAFFKRRGRAIDEQEFFLNTAGRNGLEIMRHYLGAHLSEAECDVLNAEKEAVYREIYAPHLKLTPGFEAFMARAAAGRIALAVGTAAPVGNIAFTLDGLGVRTRFDAVVGIADVRHGKPAPDIFLLAAERCGIPPEDCIVFEDAPLGVQAARHAGMRAVVLTTTLPADAFAGFDNVIATAADFSALDPDALFAALATA
jgi:beta-phosphoglucomutase family hydrolase